MHGTYVLYELCVCKLYNWVYSADAGMECRTTNLHGHKKKLPIPEAPIVIEDDAWCMMHTHDNLFSYSVLYVNNHANPSNRQELFCIGKL